MTNSIPRCLTQGPISGIRPQMPQPANGDMTFGNHGWSGGIYEIDDMTICRQLMDLVTLGLLQSIEIDGVVFFSHYQLKSAEQSTAMNEKLLAIHGGSGTLSS